MSELNIDSFNGSWTAPIFNYEIDGENIEVVGWKNMKENDETPWQPVQVVTDEGQELICAFPDSVLEELTEKEFTPNEAWLHFLNFAQENWKNNETSFIKEPENLGSFDYVKFDDSLIGKKREKVGEHAFDRFEEVFGPNPSPVAASVNTYKSFLKNALSLVAENSDILINEGNSSYTLFKDGDDGKAKFRINISNLHFNFDDVEKKWNKNIKESLSCDTTTKHEIVGDIRLYERLKDEENGEDIWNVIKSSDSTVIANVPAMNLENGMFLKDGSEYVITFVTDPEYEHKRFITPGMTLRNALYDGITVFNNTITERVSNANVNDTRSLDRLFLNLNMDDGFSQMYLSNKEIEKSDEKDIENENLDFDSKPDTLEPQDNNVKELNLEKKLSPQKVWYYAKANNVVCSWRDVLTVHMREETPNVHPYLIGIVDYSAVPEGKNAPLQGRLTSTVRFDDDGIAYNPFFKVLDGKIDESDVVWMPMLEDRDSCYKEIPTIENSIMVHAGDINEDGTFRTTSDGRVMAQQGDKDLLVFPEKVQYVAISTKYEHTPGSETGTDPSRIYGVRMIIKNSGQKDAVTTEKSQTRSFVYRSEFSSSNKIVMAEDDGIVEKIEKEVNSVGEEVPSSMTLRYNNGKEVIVDLSEKETMNSTNVFYQWLADGVNEGAPFKKGQILTNTNGISNGELTVGAAATVAFVSVGATTTDDCVAVSSEWAKKNTTRYCKEVSTELRSSINSSPYGPDLIFNPVLNTESKFFDGYDCSKLGDDGIIRNGEKISQGDVIAWRLVPDGTRKLDTGEQLAMRKPQKGVTFTDIPVTYKPKPILFDKAMENGLAKTEKIKSSNGCEILKVVAFKDKPLETGDKISIGGVKATIRVLDDDEYLKIVSPSSPLNGHTVDVFFSTGFSVLKRKAPGIMLDAQAGLMAVENNKLYDLGFDSTNVREDISTISRGDNGQRFLVGKINGKEITMQNPIQATIGVLQVMNVDKKALDHIYKSYYNEKMVDEKLEKSVKVVVQMNNAVAMAQGAYNIIEEERKRGKSEYITDAVPRAILAGAGFGVTVPDKKKSKNPRKEKKLDRM